MSRGRTAMPSALCEWSECDNALPSQRHPSMRYCNATHQQRARRDGGARVMLGDCIGPHPEGPRRAHSRDLCGSHYAQWRRGMPLTPLGKWNRVVNGVKLCGGCGQRLPVSAFHKKHGRPTNECADCRAIGERARKYGLTRDEVRALLRRSCDVCGREVSGKGQHIDHVHDTGAVRGVLCSECNVTLGLVGDDAERLRALADYVERVHIP